MRRTLVFFVCHLLLTSEIAWGRANGIKPVQIPAGTIVTFYLQTRLNPADGNAIDLLPKGTTLKIKLLDSIDSELTRDGAQFRGVVVTPLFSHGEVVIHADAEVRGLFALLRSRSHPEGFRYELLITGIADGGKLFQLTASMNPSFQDNSPQVAKSENAANDPARDKPSEAGSVHQ